MLDQWWHAWQAPVALRILVAYALFPILLKKIVGLPSRTKRFALQFLFAFAMALFFAAFTVAAVPWQLVWVVVVIGFANGFAAYCSWRAVDLSLSKMSLFTFLDDVIAMSLSFVIISDDRLLRGGTALGAALSLLAVILYAVYGYRRNAGKTAAAKDQPMFFFYVGIYSLIWGIANFSMRYYSFKEAMPTGVFLTAWYGGALLAALTLVLFYKEKGGGANTQSLSTRGILGSALLAFFIAVSLALAYWAFRFAPQTAIQPLYLVAEMTIPALIGLFIFKERKGLARPEWVFFGIGFAGGTMIALTA